MMAAAILACFVFGTILRLLLSNTHFALWFANRVEITTPINAWKRVEEGLALQKSNVSPYSGDIFHGTPLLLKFFDFTSRAFPGRQHAVFVVADILIGFLLLHISGLFIDHLMDIQKIRRRSYHKESEHLVLRRNDLAWIQPSVVAVHFFSPYSIAACVSRSTSVFTSLPILLTLYYTLKGCLLRATLSLALSTYQSLYPVTLIVPLCVHLFRRADETGSLLGSSAVKRYSLIVVATTSWLGGLLYVSYVLTGSLDFLYATYGFILSVPDLTPNIGVFWYFFTEMFEHFRVFFLCVFQMNVFIYTVPLAVKLREHPVFFMYIQTCIVCIFNSYPSYGDTALYLCLLPLWSHVFDHMRNGFIVSCMFVSCLFISPILWHLWINAGSANANFFFAVTLVFSAAQVFLVTDLLYAFLRREFDLLNGPHPKLPDGRTAVVILD